MKVVKFKSDGSGIQFTGLVLNLNRVQEKLESLFDEKLRASSFKDNDKYLAEVNSQIKYFIDERGHILFQMHKTLLESNIDDVSQSQASQDVPVTQKEGE